MRASTAVGGDIGATAWVVFAGGVMAVIFILGRDMPKPGPILSDQCLIFANLFMMIVEREEGILWQTVGCRVPPFRR
jgi:hypothetical protein